eukprot:350457-Chlamydomonas_euryale.AAC.7
MRPSITATLSLLSASTARCGRAAPSCRRAPAAALIAPLPAAPPAPPPGCPPPRTRRAATSA